MRGERERKKGEEDAAGPIRHADKTAKKGKVIHSTFSARQARSFTLVNR